MAVHCVPYRLVFYDKNYRPLLRRALKRLVDSFHCFVIVGLRLHGWIGRRLGTSSMKTAARDGLILLRMAVIRSAGRPHETFWFRGHRIEGFL